MEDFKRNIKIIPEEELRERIRKQEKALNNSFFEERRIKHKYKKTLRVDDDTEQRIIDMNLNYNKEFAKKIVLAKLSNVCINCKGEKPFADEKEACSKCAEAVSNWYETALVESNKDNKEFLGEEINRLFKYEHKLSGKEKEEKIKKWGVDI